MYEAAEGAHVLVLVTEWAMFRMPDFDRLKEMMATPVIFDGRNQYEPGDLMARGFEYHCIGRPNA